MLGMSPMSLVVERLLAAQGLGSTGYNNNNNNNNNIINNHEAMNNNISDGKDCYCPLHFV
jgi:hypothetical protein